MTLVRKRACARHPGRHEAPVISNRYVTMGGPDEATYYVRNAARRGIARRCGRMADKTQSPPGRSSAGPAKPPADRA